MILPFLPADQSLSKVPQCRYAPKANTYYVPVLVPTPCKARVPFYDAECKLAACLRFFMFHLIPTTWSNWILFCVGFALVDTYIFYLHAKVLVHVIEEWYIFHQFFSVFIFRYGLAVYGIVDTVPTNSVIGSFHSILRARC